MKFSGPRGPARVWYSRGEKKCMLRLFPRGLNEKRAGNLHDRPNMLDHGTGPSGLSSEIYLSAAAASLTGAPRVFGSDLAPPPGHSDGRRRKLQLGSHGQRPAPLLPPPCIFYLRIELVSSCSFCAYRTCPWMLALRWSRFLLFVVWFRCQPQMLGSLVRAIRFTRWSTGGLRVVCTFWVCWSC